MKKYKLLQIPCSNGINPHRCWVDEISGIEIHSNDDILGDKFYMTEGEGTNTIWYKSPTEAIKHYISIGRCAIDGIQAII